MKRRRPPPRVDRPSAAASRLDPVEEAIKRVRRAREEIREAKGQAEATEAETVEAFALFERARDRAQEAVDAEEAASERFMRASEEYLAALDTANSLGLAAQLVLERERLHFIDDSGRRAADMFGADEDE